MTRITKRLMTMTSVALAGALALAGCSSTDDAPTTAPGRDDGGDGGAYSFTHPGFDDLTVTLDGPPETIVMDYYAASALADYGLDPDGVFGWTTSTPTSAGNARLDGVPVLGQENNLDIEKLAELHPDVIVGHGGPDGWSWFKDDVNAQLVQVAPFLPLAKADDVDDLLAQTKQIAEFLGGDVDSAAVTEAERDWAAAKEELREAIGDSGLRVMFASPLKEMVYTAKGFPMANLFEEAGATIVGPDKPAEGNPWGEVAWEEFPSLDADIIFYEEYDPEALADVELWTAHPAVQAGRVHPWDSKAATSYAVQAKWLRDAAAMIAKVAEDA